MCIPTQYASKLTLEETHSDADSWSQIRWHILGTHGVHEDGKAQHQTGNAPSVQTVNAKLPTVAQLADAPDASNNCNKMSLFYDSMGALAQMGVYGMCGWGKMDNV